MSFYNLEMDTFEESLAKDIQKKAKISFTPYVVRGSSMLRKQYGADMAVGNTITAPGFYAPQGREIRLPLKYPKMLEDLSKYRIKSSEFQLTNFEMETAGYYAMARLLGHEVLSVNAIIANRAKSKFSKDPNKVVDGLIKKILNRI
jgi:uridine phosphorylase